MAPPKTMVISQQQQMIDQQASAAKQQAAKPRKRKTKQQVVEPQSPPAQPLNNGVTKQQQQPQQMQQENVAPASKVGVASIKQPQQQQQQQHVVPSERTTIKKALQTTNQVPSLVKQTTPIVTESQAATRAAVPAPPPSSIIGKHQQLASDEADDIDAGIELDGSSNSGSSVKDMSEDHMKSASASPVMAQSNLVVNESPCANGITKQATSVGVAPIEQLTGTLCSTAVTSVKKISTTKQQLAANQSVIDADEQLLQKKLESKQRKSSSSGPMEANGVAGISLAPSTAAAPAASAVTDAVDQQQQIEKKAQNGQQQTAPTTNGIDGAAKSQASVRPRRFSSQSSQEMQEASLCKVCEQHVYQMERMLAEKSIYHKRCFRCYQCKIQLRVDNYSSHEGRVYCKAHHRQIFQPQVKLDTEADVDIVAKSTSQPVDNYLLHRGRLSELSFSFLQQTPEGARQRQMIICENEPAELPKDVVRSDTKLDDGIEQLNLNLNNILEKFERGTASNGEESQPSSASVVIEKPSFNLKKTLMAFESRLANQEGADDAGDSAAAAKRATAAAERPVVRKLTNLNGFLNRQNSSQENEDDAAGPLAAPPVRPLAVRRSESLMMRLKKYESRIAGERVDDDEDGDDEDDENNNSNNNSKNEPRSIPDLSQSVGGRQTSSVAESIRLLKGKQQQPPQQEARSVPRKLTSIKLSSLKNQWENGDINKRRNDDDELDGTGENGGGFEGGAAGDNNGCSNGNSPSVEKYEELSRVRQQLARKKAGQSGSVRNIYENAIREAQLQQQQLASTRRDSSDLSALNGFSTTDIQQQLLQNSLNGGNNTTNGTDCSQVDGNNTKTPTTPNKDHFQLNFSNKANKLKEKFELGLINNSSRDDSDMSDGDDAPQMTKLEQIRQEKMDDLSVFTDGEIKAREARSLFQQIDRRISAGGGGGGQPAVSSRSLASIGASMRTKLTNQMSANGTGPTATGQQRQQQQQLEQRQQPIRLTNNVRT